MAYVNGKWTDEDEGVASRVAKYQQEDSALMRAASTQGAKAANRRGVQNSSIGIGAGITAQLGAVTPIASQEASQASTRNLAAAEDRRTRDLAAMEDRRARELAAADIASRERLTGLELGSREKLTGMEIGSREKLTGLELSAREKLALLDDTRMRDMTGLELSSREKLAAQEDARMRELTTAELGSREKLAAQEDARMRELEAERIKATDRANYVNSLVGMGNNYQAGIGSTLANPKLSGSARTGAQANLSAAYTAQQQQLAAIYGVNLNWGGGASAPPPAGPGAGIARTAR